MNSGAAVAKTDTRGRQGHRLQRPVVSIGNISMGGRGKTPVTALVARLLVEAGERPAILTRGYKRTRREDGVVVVSDGTHLLADVDRAGDEPLLLARDAPGALVLVCEMRAIAGALAERALGATVHVLDDGFQHRALARDVDIVLVAPADLTDRRVPFGRLRESPASLAAADALVIDQADQVVGITEDHGRPVFVLRRWLGAAVSLEPDRRPIPPGKDEPVVAVCGIAKPSRFTKALESDGWTVAETMAYPDHHAFTHGDLGDIAAAVKRRSAAAAVTTAKDALRLLRLRPLPVPFALVPLQVSVEPAAEFRAWLLQRVAEARA